MANASIPDARSPELVKLLDKVKELLDADKLQDAFKLLSREDSEWVRNARAVCFLRLGDPRGAVETLRGLVVAGHLSLKPDTPLVFKTNFATALLLGGNISGGEGILNDIRNEENPSVQRLRAAIRQWKAGMTFWQRLSWHMGGEPSRPFTVDFPPGEL